MATAAVAITSTKKTFKLYVFLFAPLFIRLPRRSRVRALILWPPEIYNRVQETQCAHERPRKEKPVMLIFKLRYLKNIIVATGCDAPTARTEKKHHWKGSAVAR